MLLYLPPMITVPSLPSRGAWIEIGNIQATFDEVEVAPLTGSVD